jgi:hypothetical protein
VIGAATGRDVPEPQVAIADITVDGSDVDNLTLIGSAGGTVTGRVLTEDGAVPDLPRLRVTVAQRIERRIIECWPPRRERCSRRSREARDDNGHSSRDDFAAAANELDERKNLFSRRGCATSPACLPVYRDENWTSGVRGELGMVLGVPRRLSVFPPAATTDDGDERSQSTSHDQVTIRLLDQAT